MLENIWFCDKKEKVRARVHKNFEADANHDPMDNSVKKHIELTIP